MTEPAGTSGGGRSNLRVAIPIAVVVALGAAVAWWLRPQTRPPVAPPGAASAARPAPGAAAAPGSPASSAHPSSKGGKPVEKVPAERSPVPAAAASPSLHVASDVDGANVFIDRQFVGKTPLETSDVAPGAHQLNVSAPGYDGVTERVQIAEHGATNVRVSLKTVRLEAAVAVLHKHALGSCQGTLRADPAGLRYETTNASDAFQLRWDDLEIFTVDYVQKMLRVKKRGGRTWNFTTRAPNADSLLAFQHEVDHARERLAAPR